MEPLKHIDQDTPIGTRVIVIVEGGHLSIGEYQGQRCGWAHVGQPGSEELHSPLSVFELPEVQP